MSAPGANRTRRDGGNDVNDKADIVVGTRPVRCEFRIARHRSIEDVSLDAVPVHQRFDEVDSKLEVSAKDVVVVVRNHP